MEDIMLYIMAAGYGAAGIMHFVVPKTYLKIMPPWVPRPLLMVQVSGVLEILFAVLLLPIGTRHIAAWLIIALLIAIFPANIQMAINFSARRNRYFWLAIARLPLQAVLVWWAWLYTRGI